MTSQQSLEKVGVKTEDISEHAQSGIQETSVSSQQSLVQTQVKQEINVEMTEPSMEVESIPGIGESSTSTATGALTSDPNSGSAKVTDKQPVMYLNELRKGLTYDLVAEEEREKEKVFTMGVTVDGKVYLGTARNKKMAKQEAAKQALQQGFNILYDPG